MPSLYKFIPIALSFLSFAAAAVTPYNSRSEVLEEKRMAFNLQSSAVAYATARLPPGNGHGISFISSVVGPTTATAYLTQNHDGVPFTNAPATITYSLTNFSVVSFTSSFVNPSYIYANVPNITPNTATTAATTRLGATFPAGGSFTFQYFVNSANAAIFAYVFDVQSPAGAWITVYVDSLKATVVSAVNKATGATII